VESQKSATLDEIQRCHKALLDDQYGNYVIQHVLQYGRESDRDSLLHIIVQNDLLKLSRQKFASNVVEKLLKYGNSNQRNTIVREMLHYVEHAGPEGTGGSSVLLLMVRDAYANYVVQTAIDVVPEGNEKRMLIEELKANEIQLVRIFCVAIFDIVTALFQSFLLSNTATYLTNSEIIHSPSTSLRSLELSNNRGVTCIESFLQDIGT
jgi:hypothetical protein